MHCELGVVSMLLDQGRSSYTHLAPLSQQTLSLSPEVANKASTRLSTREEMRRLLKDIQSGAFADEWMAECEAGKPNFKELEKKGKEHPIEIVGVRLRSMMPWLKQRALVDKSSN